MAVVTLHGHFAQLRGHWASFVRYLSIISQILAFRWFWPKGRRLRQEPERRVSKKFARHRIEPGPHSFYLEWGLFLLPGESNQVAKWS